MYIFNAKNQEDGSGSLDDVLEVFIARKLEASAKISPYYHELWVEIDRLFHSGGKRLRSKIVLLSYSMFGGKNIECILPAAAAQELLHMGMLMHDDIIDRDFVRYGVANISGRYRTKYETLVVDEDERTHYANSAALLAGDLMLSEAYQLMAESEVTPQKILEVQMLLGQSIFAVIGGELIDTESAFRKRGAIAPKTIALYKTASYSFTMPMMVGAQLADASSENKALLRVMGENLGIAYQLRDDIIGVFGNEAETGKSTSGDIREGKKTLMVEYFYELADETQQKEFDTYFAHPTISEEEVSRVRMLLEASGAREKTEQAIEEHGSHARRAAEQLSLEPGYISQLEALIAAATKRIK